ncbi:MAG: amidohydrolase family protein [Chloroflexi bacterium]|nr:amidohydrolase family protein [Chloroflexota bacterium]
MIDCDIHNTPASVEVLFPYLAPHWREYISQSAFKGPVDTAYPPRAPVTVDPALRTPDGPPPGTTLDTVRSQVLDRRGVEVGILTCAYAVESVHNPDAAAALARAINDWQIAEWLEPEPRLRASIVVASQQPAMAAQEVERVGGHPGFVQVFLPVRSRVLYGDRQYYPLYEAAVRHDLAIGIHFGGAPGNPPTPSGWPSYYLEEYVDMAAVFQSQLLSLIVEGVFDKFPTLRVVLIESGWSWLPGFLWRVDKEWKGLRREVPWNHQFPSEYVRQHVRFTWQPADLPSDPQQLAAVIAAMESEELLLFSSDYPHRHDEGEGEALLATLPTPLRLKITRENARAFYRLPLSDRTGEDGGQGGQR